MENSIDKLHQKYGEDLFAWVAHDYHPHQRGFLWYIIFIIAFGGTALWAFFAEDFGWITSFCIMMVAAIYFWTHRNGEEFHNIVGFKKGLLVDNKAFFDWYKFKGFWFLYDNHVSVVNFELKDKNRKITLQLGNVLPEQLREKLKEVGLEEIPDKKESLIDLWIRALKL